MKPIQKKIFTAPWKRLSNRAIRRLLTVETALSVESTGLTRKTKKSKSTLEDLADCLRDEMNFFIVAGEYPFC